MGSGWASWSFVVGGEELECMDAVVVIYGRLAFLPRYSSCFQVCLFFPPEAARFSCRPTFLHCVD
jgi:hypothetical protein